MYLTKNIIVYINKKTVERHGGNFVPPNNYLNEEALDYLIDAISSEMFGEPLYPNIEDKAALYFFNIISNHIFQDGNKRTGLEAALLFLELNGYELQINRKNQENSSDNEILETFVMDTASGHFDLDYCKNWFKENTRKLSYK